MNQLGTTLGKLFLLTALLTSLPTLGQQKATVNPDLTAIGQGGTAVNRSTTALTDGTRKGIRFDARSGDGLLWLPGLQLTNGDIEFDLRGQNVLQQSFLGLAFHGQDDNTYEAVYFRPFNFQSQDSVRRVHAVQYINHPTYTWQKLRTDFPNKYEAAILPAPDPTDWFHVRVNIANSTVRVFVNQIAAPVLVVERLSQQPGGRVGFWVGNTSPGDFANLVVRPVE